MPHFPSELVGLPSVGVAMSFCPGRSWNRGPDRTFLHTNAQRRFAIPRLSWEVGPGDGDTCPAKEVGFEMAWIEHTVHGEAHYRGNRAPNTGIESI